MTRIIFIGYAELKVREICEIRVRFLIRQIREIGYAELKVREICEIRVRFLIRQIREIRVQKNSAVWLRRAKGS